MRLFNEDHIALITGASSGIGKETALMCAKAGMKVVLVDIDEEDLTQAVLDVTRVTACCAPGAPVLSYAVDVSQNEACQQLAQRVFEAPELGNVHFLMNNAGTGRGGGALVHHGDTDKSPAQHRSEMEHALNVNMWGVINMCQAFVPLMEKAGLPGIIVNTGSKQGMTFPPGNLAYNISKGAVKAYTEGLQHELREREGALLTAHMLVPGWTNTQIMLKSKRDQASLKGEAFDPTAVYFSEGRPREGAWEASQVVNFMMQGLSEGKFYIICPDNEVDRDTDNKRITWAAQDVTEDRPPLSRWHPEWKGKFEEYMLQ